MTTACGSNNNDRNSDNDREPKDRETDSKSDSKDKVFFTELVSMYPEDFDLPPNVQKYIDSGGGGFIDPDISELKILGELRLPPSIDSDLIPFNDYLIGLDGWLYWQITDSGITGPFEFERPSQILPEDDTNPILELELIFNPVQMGLKDDENMKVYFSQTESFVNVWGTIIPETLEGNLMEIDLSDVLEGRITYKLIPLSSEAFVRSGCVLSVNDIWCFDSDSFNIETGKMEDLKLVRVNRNSGEVDEYEIIDSTFIENFAFYSTWEIILKGNNLAAIYADEEISLFYVFDLSAISQSDSIEGESLGIEPAYRYVRGDDLTASIESKYYAEFLPLCDLYLSSYSPFYTDDYDKIELEDDTFIQIYYHDTKPGSDDMTRIYKYREAHIDSFEIIGKEDHRDLVDSMIEGFKADPDIQGRVWIIENYLSLSDIYRCFYKIYPHNNLLLVGHPTMYVIRYGE